MTEERTALDGFMTGRATAMLLVGLVGLASVLWFLVGVISAPWQLDERSPTVMSSSADCDAKRGAQYQIRVDGESYSHCGGATNRCGEVEAVAVAYDARDPAQCRVASAAGRIGRYEATFLLLGLGLSFAGAAGASFLLSQRTRRAGAGGNLSTEAAAARFQRLQRISWASLAAATLTANGTALYLLL
ncbi:MAG: hypothetical protein KUG77_24380 [Nannocystaceae bacterium]|nr:hypothetical protein [Nannocystaceae bacterium]